MCGEEFRCGVSVHARTPQFVRCTVVGVGDEIVPERQRRELGTRFPHGRKGHGPIIAGVDAELRCRILELAVAESSQDRVRSTAKDDEVEHAITVDVERVCPGDRGEVGRW